MLLTGSNTAREKTQLKKLVRGRLGPYCDRNPRACSKPMSSFKRLGLAIVDEQHRFGVMQRLKLYEKGQRPDVLVMTATPIPRTLALTVYGDLDTSIIDELPPGRKPIHTKHVMEDRVEQVYSFVKKQVDAGRQAYVVYPVIEESETQAMKAAQAMHEQLSQSRLPGPYRSGLLHGKMTAGREGTGDGAFQTRRDEDPGLHNGH